MVCFVCCCWLVYLFFVPHVEVVCTAQPAEFLQAFLLEMSNADHVLFFMVSHGPLYVLYGLSWLVVICTSRLRLLVLKIGDMKR